ncbi:DUF4177 domain-containing protein [Eubacterium multiforme]|uniref:DUF4177 domain-containing protein n=1 Tax=Eubacterium multiforme TaxID=83339 RepID=A0ABT9URB4_9FIRM|nr:DUF4177 domain-containing protein [Eubacterium multiforme]MDQ0148648.1 hypothetical protein [Eubacterium multiforme]
MYEYKFVKIPFEHFLNSKKDEGFDRCKKVIVDESKDGWRLKQVFIPANEKTGIFTAYCYEVIFERKIDL